MNNKEVFSKIYKEDLWHGGSGAGSKIENVKEYVDILQKYIDKPEIKTVLDLGCGDWQFSKFLDLSSVSYLGVDVVESVVESNKNSYSASNIEFISHDITTYEIPKVDLIICKDVLQHLCNKDVIDILIKIVKSSKFSLVTNDFTSEDSVNRDINNGSYRCLDLSLSPFNLDVVTLLEYQRPGWKPKRTVTLN
jgi:2-polyprenyl-3-methyl-5-hydroxy-6-metoxy-1,4-benzoquinol methylase